MSVVEPMLADMPLTEWEAVSHSKDHPPSNTASSFLLQQAMSRAQPFRLPENLQRFTICIKLTKCPNVVPPRCDVQTPNWSPFDPLQSLGAGLEQPKGPDICTLAGTRESSCALPSSAASLPPAGPSCKLLHGQGVFCKALK